jgi:hypothetical protein
MMIIITSSHHKDEGGKLGINSTAIIHAVPMMVSGLFSKVSCGHTATCAISSGARSPRIFLRPISCSARGQPDLTLSLSLSVPSVDGLVYCWGIRTSLSLVWGGVNITIDGRLT